MLHEDISTGHGKSGCIEVICGSMFSGKTEELFRRLRRARIARLKVEIFKHAIDVRYDQEHVVSHDENSMASRPVSDAAAIPELAGDADIIAIDEAQFFDSSLPGVCLQLANSGKRIIVAGLDMDFRGKPFGPIPELMAIAEYVTKVHAICLVCGELANFSHRMHTSQNLVEIGEREIYQPLCRKHFLEAQKSTQ